MKVLRIFFDDFHKTAYTSCTPPLPAEQAVKTHFQKGFNIIAAARWNMLWRLLRQVINK
jgi:hypothetical protein